MDGPPTHTTVFYQPCMPGKRVRRQVAARRATAIAALVSADATPVMDVLSEKKPATNRLPTLQVVYRMSPTRTQESTPELDCVYIR